MSTYRIERDRGIKEYRQQLAELRQKWPLAFPVHDEDVRPLAVDAAHEIAAVMGWSYPYTLGVLSRWKMARRAASTPAKKAAKSAAPTAAKSKRASAPPSAPPRETPKQLRDRVRASLLRRRV